ncbi:MAG: hypothetical protein KOO60_02565 [Gemmatimonadales bacterium]|nr:hypothetical protein [Gemmatimonadales bacterium]
MECLPFSSFRQMAELEKKGNPEQEFPCWQNPAMLGSSPAGDISFCGARVVHGLLVLWITFVFKPAPFSMLFVVWVLCFFCLVGNLVVFLSGLGFEIQHGA